MSETLLNLGPIGLTFSNTDSFLDLVEKRIFHAKNTKNVSGTNRNPGHGAVEEKLINDAEKLKASNFGASLLRIGSWKVKKKNNHTIRKVAVNKEDEKKFVSL